MTNRSIIKMAVITFLASVFIAGCQKAQKITSLQKADNETSTFINSPDGLTGALKENYVDFQFDYPKSWVMDPASSQDGASNFVRVERRIADKGGKFTQENFAVGYFHGTGTASGDKALMPKVAKGLEEKFAQNFDNYKFISDGPAKLGSYSGYEFRFESIIKDTPHGTVTLWGRTILLPNPKASEKNGVSIVIMGSNLVPEIKSAADVGVKGQLPVILKSFKMGKDAIDSAKAK
ncbi:MAG: hypothetical protein ABI210_14090 [Abditibacteriaceae bacterium]